jgi:outer membrane protein assembly factor BamB
MKKLFILFAFIEFNLAKAQEPWVFQYNYSIGYQIVQSYDGGVVIAARTAGPAHTGKIFKVNKLGEVLWTHTIEENEGVTPLAMVEAKNGDLIIAGQTFQYEDLADAFILRLNACGEVLWFKNVGFVDVTDWITNMVDIHGSVVAAQITNIPSQQRYNLVKIDASGEVLWFKNLVLDNGWGGGAKALSKCKDGGFVIVGDAYVPPYYDQSSTMGSLRSITLKTDSLGNLEWYNIFRWEEDTNDSIIKSIGSGVAELENGHFSVLCAKIQNGKYPPTMYELNENGELLWHKNIAKPNTKYSNSNSVLTKDSTIIVGVSTYSPEEDAYHEEYYKMDLLGNKLAEYVDNMNSSALADFRLSPDSSSLYCLPGSSGVIHAIKLNPYTMQLDSFAVADTTVYDYYCPEAVTELNYFFPELGTTELEAQKERPQLYIAPNPAKEHSYFYFDIKNYKHNATLELHNLKGELLSSQKIEGAVGSIYQDLSGFSPGIYLLSLVVDGAVVETVKLSVTD